MRKREQRAAQIMREHRDAVRTEERFRYLEEAVAKLGAPGRDPGTHDDGTEGSHYSWQCSPGLPCWEGKLPEKPKPTYTVRVFEVDVHGHRKDITDEVIELSKKGLL